MNKNFLFKDYIELIADSLKVTRVDENTIMIQNNRGQEILEHLNISSDHFSDDNHGIFLRL